MTRALKLEQVLKEEDILTPGDLSAVISLLFPEHSVSRLKASACVTKVAASPHISLLGEMHHSSNLQHALLYK